MPGQVRYDCIRRASAAGLKVSSESAKKDQAMQLTPVEICDQIASDLATGADKVIIEARESSRGIGIYDEEGLLRMDEMTTIVNCLGDSRGDVIWEAPLKKQQAALILCCGPNVNLGNVRPNDVLGLEAMRCRLRFETLRQHFVYENAIFLIIKLRAMPNAFLGNQRETSPIPIFYFWAVQFLCYFDI